MVTLAREALLPRVDGCKLLKANQRLTMKSVTAPRHLLHLGACFLGFLLFPIDVDPREGVEFKRNHRMQSEPESGQTGEQALANRGGGRSAAGQPRQCIFIKRCGKTPNGHQRCNTPNPDGSCGCGRGGKRCLKFAAPGTTVCHKHGGAASQIVQAARMKILRNVVPAIAGVVEISRRRGRCQHCDKACGHGSAEDKDRIKAAEFLANRSGLGPESKVVMDVQENEWLKKLTDAELDTILELRDRAALRSAKPEDEEVAS